jgi:hypothetical protein
MLLSRKVAAVTGKDSSAYCPRRQVSLLHQDLVAVLDGSGLQDGDNFSSWRVFQDKIGS